MRKFLFLIFTIIFSVNAFALSDFVDIVSLESKIENNVKKKLGLQGKIMYEYQIQN